MKRKAKKSKERQENNKEFSFRQHAMRFDNHIISSIPGYPDLLSTSVALSRRFIQHGTMVVDIGCTTGRALAAIRKANEARPSVRYVGLDLEPEFECHWRKLRTSNLTFEVCDVRSFAEFTDLSFACSLFTVQFLAPRDKVPLLKQVHAGLIEGGAMVIAEKTLASTARLQDALTFPYYDRKLTRFSAAEILDKERSLRGQMALWSEAELKDALLDIGFQEIEPIWANFPFVALLALK